MPGHPVQRFRFVVGRLAAPDVGAGEAAESPATGAAEASGQGSEAPAAKEKRRDQPPAQGADEAARAQAEGVDDGRLRAAIEAALRRSSEEPPEAPGRGTPSG